MGYFYCDDSVQQIGSFVIGAFVYSSVDLTRQVFKALEDCGKVPGEDEYKSALLMAGDENNIKLRSKIRNLLSFVRLGITVVPESRRSKLGESCLACLSKILDANAMTNVTHNVFFDEGIIASEQSKQNFTDKYSNLCVLHFDQDSRRIGGIQVADLVAHSAGIMLLETLDIKKKYIKAGLNSGYDPDLEVELGFALWSSLRYSFFRADQAIGCTSDDPVGTMEFNVRDYGLFVSADCSRELAEAADIRFGTCYLGCIH